MTELSAQPGDPGGQDLAAAQRQLVRVLEQAQNVASPEARALALALIRVIEVVNRYLDEDRTRLLPVRSTDEVVSDLLTAIEQGLAEGIR